MNIYQTSTIQLYPSRITITNRPPKKTCQHLVDSYSKKRLRQLEKERYTKNFSAVKNPFVISKATKKKIFDSVNSMFCLSKPRTVTMQNDKKLYNFQLAFITLTLPSKQNHDDTFIKSECLNQFLVELRKNYGVNNYVWKAELQGNQNIHFHLIVDKYIDFQALRRRWNRILEKHNYIAAYRVKFKNLNLSQYHAMRNRKASCSFEKSKAAFAAGQRSNWSNPNSVDVRMVRSKKDLAVYLGKYISKPISKETSSDIELERQLNFGRSWSRSYSLAKLKYQNKFIYSEVKELIKYLDHKTAKFKKCIGTFFIVYFFNFRETSKAFQQWHLKFIYANARLYNYPFP